jgi:hypothetical protein
VDGLLSIQKKLISEKDKEQRTKAKSKMTIQQVSLIKLLADFIFCSIDVFKLEKERIQVYAGLLASMLSSYKLYVKHSDF